MSGKTPANWLKEFLEDLDWAGAHHSELMKKYPEKWVAILNKKVIAVGETLEKVKEKAKALTGKEHIPVYFVDSCSNIYESKFIL